MTVTAPRATAGDLLRGWRVRRRRSQLDLAVDADVSTRHLSFVETGRSKPSRELLLHLATHLDVPLRDRNAMLLAAGYAPEYAQRGLDEPAVRAALDRILAGHEPYPALVVDQRWTVYSANPTARLLTDGVAAWLLEPPINVLRVSLHPEGLGPRIANLAEWSGHVTDRLRRHGELTGDPAIAALREELLGYPGPTGAGDESAVLSLADQLYVPLRLRVLGTELEFFSTVSTFGTALDITLAELSIESFFPADEQTVAALRRRAAVG